MPDTITIKKYPNRRLYNTKKSTYITLEDVSDLIKKGFRIQVVDVNTGNDVTSIVLTQIIMNKAKKDNAILPVSLLHLVIQYGESHLHEFFEKYLETTIKNYLGYRKQMDDQINAYMEMGMDFSTLAEKTFRNMDPMNFFSNSLKKQKKED
ncbi:polyhydroxyalkanoate synthesis repressor PhaR [Desulfobacula phenolica]|uniref:Polyhydroxyalkanoate synthesis repressor PhaR n=1 Tax=Desulfobacula phenolica TaxID=90732 RepID=A0A1H2DUP5_9BACT|nr:polyhydroxyalkanoate synthesis regulator DNA-binding domain-containing protein [Desulfobacula phenolica]SDT86559.1 polyhydroxyalkanoate synthesis repressor PhaR [Desulfobacula phenolica]